MLQREHVEHLGDGEDQTVAVKLGTFLDNAHRSAAHLTPARHEVPPMLGVRGSRQAALTTCFHFSTEKRHLRTTDGWVLRHIPVRRGRLERLLGRDAWHGTRDVPLVATVGPGGVRTFDPSGCACLGPGPSGQGPAVFSRG